MTPAPVAVSGLDGVQPPVALSRGGRVARLAVEAAPAFVVALLILPYVIALGSFWPWHPSTTDLQVYVAAVHDMLAGKDIYATRTPVWNLPFIYPPIAAVLMIPLAVGPYVMWQIVWTAGLIGAQTSVLIRCGLPRGPILAVLNVLLVLVVEPIRTTLGYGQINTFLLFLVVADLLPRRPGLPLARRRVIPRGWLIGLAAALKLTPALFIVFAFVLGKKRLAGHGLLSYVVFTGIGAIVQFGPTVAFYGGVLHGNIGAPAPPYYVGNQSITGAVTRLARSGSASFVVLGLAISAIVALLALLVARHWWRGGPASKTFALGLVGMATCLASPLSWTHHFVWVVPLGVGLAATRALPRWARVVGAVWAVWVGWSLMLMVLPYAYDHELSYNAGQLLIADLGPALGVVLIAGLALRMVRADPALGHRRVRDGARPGSASAD